MAGFLLAFSLFGCTMYLYNYLLAGGIGMKRIAILGAGHIACSMANTVNGMKTRGDAVELYAVASR